MNRTEGLLSGILLGLIVLLFLVMSLGCRTCPPCVPSVETVEVKVPVAVCPEPPEVQPLSLPAYPILPDNPTEEELKDYYAEVVRVNKIRFEAVLSRMQMLQDLLEGYATPE